MLMRPTAWIARLMLILSMATIAASFLAVGRLYPILLWLAAGAVAFRGRRAVGLWSHGTSRMSWFFDLLNNGLLGREGLILGRVGVAERPTLGQAVRLLLDPRVASDVACQAVLSAVYNRRWAAERMIRVRRFNHLLTVAPAGKGKSVSVLVPNLLSYTGSVVICDPKSELWHLTSSARERLGQRVFLLDPGGLCRAASDGFNPLDFIDPSSPDFFDRCRDLANMLVIRTGEEREPYWNDASEIILTAFIAFTCTEPNKHLRNLTTVLKLLSSRAKYLSAIKVMMQTEGYGGLIQRLGQMLTWFVDRELGSVMTTTQRHIAWIHSPAVAACLSSTSFDPRLLRTGRVSVYLVLAHDKMTVWQGLMRTWLGSIMRITTRGVPSERNPVLFLIDEAGNIGNMRALQDGITLMRGMGIRIWLFFQNLGQLYECYGKHAPIILGNLEIQQYFGLNDYDTAELVSKRIGEQTILVNTDSGGKSYSWPDGLPGREPQPGNRSVNSGWSEAPTGRAVLQPSEILVLPPSVSLTFVNNLPVIPATLLRYYDAPEFKNGSTGVQRGMGLGTVLAAAAVLMVSLVLGLGTVGGLPEMPRLAALAPGLSARLGDAFGRSQASGDGEYFSEPWQFSGFDSPPPVWRSRRQLIRPAYRSYPYQMPPEWDRFNFWDPSTWGYGY
jgi:type IV secretion system protein VirD4